MGKSKTQEFKKLLINSIGLICLSSFISAQAQEVFEERSSSIETSYLESKDELKDYILDTGDTMLIRFKNRPREILKEGINQKISKSDISYLKPRNDLENYILDSGDILSIDFVKTPELSDNFFINEYGEINITRLENIYVKGLTIAELKILLEKSYEQYLLSPEINIKINNFKFIPSGTFTVDEEGEILLPEISNDPKEITRKTYVRGLTKYELKNLLEKRYSTYYMNTEVFISIQNFKPIRVSVRGEVRSPGLIKFPAFIPTGISTILDPLDANSNESQLSSNNFKTQPSNLNSNNITKSPSTINSQELLPNKNGISELNTIANNKIKRDSEYVTTLANAIRGAGGLTSYSDISQIEIIRDIPIGKGGGKKRAIINFKSYITQADPVNDIRLFDGDYIFVPSLQEKDPTIIPNSILSGLSPKFITVSVSGQIQNTGEVNIPIEGSLSDVMSINGPRKPLSGKIYLIRYNKDGTVLRKNINYSSTASPGSSQNPFLVAGDLITVKDSIWGAASNTIGAVTKPFVGIYALNQFVDFVKDKSD